MKNTRNEQGIDVFEVLEMLQSNLSDLGKLPEGVVAGVLPEDMTPYRLMVASFIAKDERFNKEILDMYQANEEQYLLALTEAGFTDWGAYESLTFELASLAKKMYSILLYEEQKHGVKSLVINRFFKKAFKPVHTFVNQKADPFSLDDFMAWAAKRQKIDLDSSNISGFVDLSYAVIYYCQLNEKVILPSKVLKKMVRELNILLLDSTEKRAILSNMGVGSLYKRLVKEHGLKDGETITAREFLDSLAVQEEEQTAMLTLLSGLTGGSNEELEAMHYHNSPLTRMVASMTLVFNLWGIPLDATNIWELSQDDVDVILRMASSFQKEFQLTDQEVMVMVALGTHAAVIHKEYFQTRKAADSAMESTPISAYNALVEEKESLKEIHEAEKAALEEQLKSAQKEARLASDLGLEANDTIDAMQLEMKRLQLELDKRKESDKELTALRSFFFKHGEGDRDSYDKSVSTEDKVEFLKGYNLALVGGHPNLTKKLRDTIPFISYVSEGEVSRKIDFLANKDVVFYISHHSNHTLYYKVLSVLSNSDTPLHYLDRKTNMDILVDQMYEYLINNNND